MDSNQHMMLSRIRNFCIIAHIDHGKSTLADRLLEVTGTVPKREMHDQMLDQMDIEQERGITIKLAPVRMHWKDHELNLIDTPGHVDFTYEVSRSLAAVEGAVLVVDATQGIQAQTLANLDLATAEGLAIIPVINKIDLPNADVLRVQQELIKLLQISPDKIILASAKQGQGIETILERVIADVPAPQGQAVKPFRALIFDSQFDPYKGVVAYVRVVDGQVAAQQKVAFLAAGTHTSVLEVGAFRPKFQPVENLTAGQIGYIVTSLKDVGQARVGDTIAIYGESAEALPGYREAKPMVFAGVFPISGDDYPKLRDALDKLRLNDAALSFEPEHSPALGHGFRCGFLGLLHLDIVRERIQREYKLEILMTTPSVAYLVYRRGQPEPTTIRSPLELPDPSQIERVEEPMMHLDIVTPATYIGPIMERTADFRGVFLNLEYLESDRAILRFTVPLASILVDFYDTLKSVSSGYATLNYELAEWRAADVIRLDVLVAGDRVDALSTMVYRDTAYHVGRRITETLKGLLPRQMFEVKIQAALGGKIIASESLPAMRKDVTAKLYGGDVTRKRKLLEKQKKGKQRLKAMGKVDIPQEAYFAVLKR